MSKKIRIDDVQTAYSLGYSNPALLYRGAFAAPHVSVANAYHCGQSDAQNQAPKASVYREENYDYPSCERKPEPPPPQPRAEGEAP